MTEKLKQMLLNKINIRTRINLLLDKLMKVKEVTPVSTGGERPVRDTAPDGAAGYTRHYID